MSTRAARIGIPVLVGVLLLVGWQALNATAFLVSGVAGNAPQLLGADWLPDPPAEVRAPTTTTPYGSSETKRRHSGARSSTSAYATK